MIRGKYLVTGDWSQSKEQYFCYGIVDIFLSPFCLLIRMSSFRFRFCVRDGDRNALVTVRTGCTL